MKESDLVKQIALTIATYGWVQRRDGDIDEGFCIQGALRFVVSETRDPDVEETGWQVTRFMDGGLAGNNFCCVTCWNDTRLRTAEEVDIFLRDTAQQLVEAGR